MYTDLLIEAGVNLFIDALKDTKKARRWQELALKVFAAIARTYRLQQDFHETANKELNS